MSYRGKVNLRSVESVGGGGVERGVKVKTPGLIFPEQLSQDLGVGGHQGRGDSGRGCRFCYLASRRVGPRSLRFFILLA